MTNTYTSWLKWSLIGGLFATLLIPFIIAPGILMPVSMFFPFITGKNFVFRILVELMLGLYVVLALREPKYRPRSSSLLWAMGAFVVWVGVSVIFSVDPVKSFWSNFERMEGYVGLVHLAAYFLVASAVLTAENLWTRFLQTSLGVSVLISVYGLFQLFGKISIDQGSTRLDGTLGNAAYMAVYELFNIFFALFLLARDWNSRTLRWVYAGVIALDTFILLYTQTRGTVLGLIAGLTVAAIYLLIATAKDPEWAQVRKISKIGLGTIAVLVVLFFAVRQVPAVQHSAALGRLATISLTDNTTKSRFMIWHMAYDGFKEKPLFGWGQENFSYVFNKYYNPEMWGQEAWFDRAHNAFIDWLTAAGAPGFILFISLFGAAAVAIVRARQLSLTERAALLGLLAGYAVHEMFVFDNLISYMQFFTVLALAHGLSQRELPKQAWLARPMSDEGVAIAAPIAAIAVAGMIMYLNAGGISSAMGLVNAVQPPSSPAGLTNNLAAFKATLAGVQLGHQEETEQLAEFAIQVSQAQAVSPEVKTQFYNAAHDALDKMTAARKGDARLELFYAVLLDSFGQYPEAQVHLLKAHNASPKKQQIMFEAAMNNLMPAGQHANAAMMLGSAYDLAPDYDLARIYYVGALYRLDANSEEANRLLETRFGTTTPDNTPLLQVFIQTKQYDRAEAMLEARIQKDPNDSQTWLRYAGVYYAAGDKAGAIKILQRASAANPAFAKEANSLIGQLLGVPQKPADSAPTPVPPVPAQ